MNCSIHGCDETAGWRQEGRDYCRAHALEAAIRTGRPMALVCPMQATEPAPSEGPPTAVWDHLSAVWDGIDLADGDAVEQLVTCALEQGMTQAMELARLRGGAAS